jgi:hypothetical protein
MAAIVALGPELAGIIKAVSAVNRNFPKQQLKPEF